METPGLEALADDDPGLQTTADDDPDMPASEVTAAGGLSALDIPGGAAAMNLLIKSNADARAALAKAREQIAARKYNKAIALFAVSGALGAPTRTGSSAEGWANAANAMVGPLREKSQFEQQQQKDLLGVDTSMAGLDQNTAMAQMQLAALSAKLKNAAALVPNNIVIGKDGKPRYAARPAARGEEAYVTPPATTTVNVHGEQKFAETFGAEASKMYVEQYQAASKAPAELERNARIRKLIESGAYTGMGAKWKLGFDQALSAAGIDFGGDKIANTEQLGSELSAGTLALIKPSGLGGGTGFSNADREFIEKVAGGSITLNRDTLLRLSKLHDRAQRNVLRTWNASHARLSKKPTTKQLLDDFGFEALPMPGETPDVTAPPVAAQPAVAPPAVAPPAAAMTRVPGAARNPNMNLTPAEQKELADLQGQQEMPTADDLAPASYPKPTPEAFEHLRQHPETKAKFLKTFGFLPNGY